MGSEDGLEDGEYRPAATMSNGSLRENPNGRGFPSSRVSKGFADRGISIRSQRGRISESRQPRATEYRSMAHRDDGPRSLSYNRDEPLRIRSGLSRSGGLRSPPGIRGRPMDHSSLIRRHEESRERDIGIRRAFSQGSGHRMISSPREHYRGGKLQGRSPSARISREPQRSLRTPFGNPPHQDRSNTAGKGELVYSKSLEPVKRETKDTYRKDDRVKGLETVDTKERHQSVNKLDKKVPEVKKVVEPKLGADEILQRLREIEEKKEDVELNLHDAQARLERLQTSEPRLTKALNRISSRMPVAPSPDSRENSVSDEVLSSESSDDSDGDSLGEEKKKWRKKHHGDPVLLLSQLKKIPPSQRKLVSRLGCALHESNSKRERDHILLQSRDMAHASISRFSRLMPKEITFTSRTGDKATSHEIIRDKLRSVISRKAAEVKVGVRLALEKEFASMLRKQLMAAIKYRFAFENWRASQIELRNAGESSLGSAMHRCSSLASAKSGIGSETEPTSPSLGRSSRGRRGVVRSDLEERLAIATLQAIESVKTMTKIPTQSIFSERSTRWIRNYHDMNRLVSDPVAALEQQKYMRPWNAAEKATFAEKFLLHHKDFDRISNFLPNRTIPEIIRYYYGIQRTAEFDKTRRKIQLRKRREKAEESALQRLGDPSNRMSIGPIGERSKDRTSAGNSERENSNTSAQAKQGKSGTKKKGGKKQREQSVNSLVSEEFLHSNHFEIPTHQGKGPRAPRTRRQSLSIEIKQFIMELNDATSYEDSEPVPQVVINSDCPQIDGSSQSPRMDRQKRQRTMPLDSKDIAREESLKDNKPVGRGRLPNIKTDRKYIEAVQIYGKDFHAIASYMNRTVEAAKKYWERHSERLELHRLVDDIKGPRDGEESSDIDEDESNLLVYSEWAPSLSILRMMDSNAAVQNSPNILNALRDLLKRIPEEESKKASSLMLPGGELGSLLASQSQSRRLQVLLPGLLQSDASQVDDVIDLLRAIDAYFQIYHAEEVTEKVIISNPAKIPKAGRGRGPVWSEKEKRAILQVFNQHGKDWDKMQDAAPNKTITQIKNFYQNYKNTYFRSTGDVEGNGPSLESCKKRKAEELSYPEATAVPSAGVEPSRDVKIEEAQQLANFLNSLSDPHLQNILTMYMESHDRLKGAHVSKDDPMHQMLPRMSETSIDALLGEISMLIESSEDRRNSILRLQEILSQQDAAREADVIMEQQDFKNATEPALGGDRNEAEK